VTTWFSPGFCRLQSTYIFYKLFEKKKIPQVKREKKDQYWRRSGVCLYFIHHRIFILYIELESMKAYKGKRKLSLSLQSEVEAVGGIYRAEYPLAR
jgi:hypothetical protein